MAREAKETAINVEIDLDGAGKSTMSTGIGVFDHRLDDLARHSLIDTVEDTCIALGQAIREADRFPT